MAFIPQNILAVILCTLVYVLFFSNSVSGQNPANLGYGICVMQGTVLNPGLSGTVQFQVLASGKVQVTAYITGITVNTNIFHGMHVHQYGDLSTSNAAAVASHFIGDGSTQHGCPEVSDIRHEGDMGNWFVSSAGILSGTKIMDLLDLTGGNSIIGRAVILHSFTDDCNITGSSLVRIGQGVIGIGSTGSLINNAHNPNTLNLTQAYCLVQNSNVSGTPLSGEFWFLEGPGQQIQISGYVNLTDGKSHGIHIHFWGDLHVADLSSAGPHYSYLYERHAFPSGTNHHLGDMGNLNPLTPGPYWYNTIFKYQMSLKGLRSVLGRALIIHQNPDDGVTQPTGNSGLRYAGCVIGLANPAFFSPKPPPFQPSTAQGLDDPCIHTIGKKSKARKLLNKVCTKQLHGTPITTFPHSYCCNMSAFGAGSTFSFNWPTKATLACQSLSTHPSSTPGNIAPRGSLQKFFDFCYDLHGTYSCDPVAGLWTCSGTR